MATVLTGSVGDKKTDGKRSENIPGDVMKVQLPLSTLTKNHTLLKGVYPEVKLTAKINTKDLHDPTMLAIRAYQRHVEGSGPETGRIDNGTNQLKNLRAAATRVRPDFAEAPIGDQIRNKLTQLLHSDDLSYLRMLDDPNGTTMCILSKLVNRPEVDDSFYNKPMVDTHLSGGGTPPPIKPISFMGALGVGGRPHNNAQTFARLKEVEKELIGGILDVRKVNVYARSEDTGEGPAAIVLERWMNLRKEDENSLYNCCRPQLEDPIGFWAHYVD